MTLLEAALDYQTRGLRVLPLHSIAPSGECSCLSNRCTHAGKHPRFAGWQERASLSPESPSIGGATRPTRTLALPQGRGYALSTLMARPEGKNSGSSAAQKVSHTQSKCEPEAGDGTSTFRLFRQRVCGTRSSHCTSTSGGMGDWLSRLPRGMHPADNTISFVISPREFPSSPTGLRSNFGREASWRTCPRKATKSTSLHQSQILKPTGRPDDRVQGNAKETPFATRCLQGSRGSKPCRK